MTTIKDVAARAGVGIGTVSRVLNHHKAVTDETRARVLDAIASLDYQPSRVARALSRRRAGAIAVVVPFFTHPSAIERLRGVLAGLEDSPYQLILFNVERGEVQASRFARLVRRDLADALLVLSLRPDEEECRRLRETGIPIVFVDAEAMGFPTVIVDDVSGGRLAARHLLDLGHRRVGYIGDPAHPRFGFTSSVRRRMGYAAELQAAGCPLQPGHVREGRHDRDVAHQLALEILDAPDRPTAVFAHSDTQALGVLGAADELDLSVPADLSVIGFDDIEAAHYAGLTTVRQPLFDSGRLGATRLLALLGGANPGPARIELPLEIVPRRTTGPAPEVGSVAVRPLAAAGRPGGSA